ncbi:MFS transporter [Novosphingobium aquae]|uniref:MFS transporter n=1 Tax=Novosphingobium aquae TaxID=3133435 RepID=A0ABU8SDS3_9SPHN
MRDADQQGGSWLARARAPGGSLGPFRHPAFAAIWTANLFSAIGSSVQSVGAAWLMTDLTSSHRLIAMVQSSVTLPIMALGLFAGAIADNFDRRRVMLAAQISMLLASAVLAVMTYEDMIGPASLLVLTLVLGAGTALNSPAWQASVRTQVGAEDLPAAISLNTIAFNLARSIGPALGGLLISFADVGAAFALNTVSFLAMIWVLWRWRPGSSPPVRQAILPSIAAGLRFCFTSSPLRKVLARGFAVGFGIAGYQALIPVVVREQLHGSEFDFGVMLCAFGLGSILSALALPNARRRHGTEIVVGLGTFCYVVPLLVLPFLTQVAYALPFAFIAGAGWATCLTTLNMAMQFRSPDAILGRCLSTYSAVTFGGMAIGAWAWGAVADWQGLGAALLAAGAWMLLVLAAFPFIAPLPKRDEGRVETT